MFMNCANTSIPSRQIKKRLECGFQANWVSAAAAMDCVTQVADGRLGLHARICRAAFSPK